MTRCDRLTKNAFSLTGFWNTAFAHYVVEEPSVTTSVINTAAITVPDSADKEQTSQPQTTEHTASICYAKETEL